MNEILKLPIVWIVLGTVIAGFIFYVANRKVFAMQSTAVQLLATVNKETITALQHERNTYREQLHLEKQSHQTVLLENEHLKAQPNLTEIGTLLKNQAKIMETISAAFNAHSECDAKIFAKIDASLTLMQKSLELMNKKLTKSRAKAKRVLA